MTIHTSGYVVKQERNGITVSATLYGDVSPERIEQAKKDLLYRLDQLQPVSKTDSQERRYDEFHAYHPNRRNGNFDDMEFEMDDEYDEFDDDID